MRTGRLTAVIAAASLALSLAVHAHAGSSSRFAAGAHHGLAVKGDGTLWSWGFNLDGQLGYSTGGDIANPSPASVDGSTDWSVVVAGGDTSFALKTDGTLWAWGNEVVCGIGFPDRLGRTVPTQIGTDNDWTTLSTSGSTRLALKADGSLWGWGLNGVGEVGIGNQQECVVEPTQVAPGIVWAVVAAGDGHSLALDSNGTLWAWGDNSFGQIGDGGDPQAAVTSPKQIGQDNDWTAVAAGIKHSLALKASESLWAWGDDSFGQLGNGGGGDTPVPTQVGSDTDWSAIQAGWTNSMALKAEGTLWTWGQNLAGNLGLGKKFRNVSQVEAPTKVGRKSDWTAVAPGYYPSFASKTDDTLWAWGGNAYGGVGVGTLGGEYLSPVEIMSLAGDVPPPLCTDQDLDGYSIDGGECGPVDCDDLDNQVNPGTTEACGDGKDNDCDGKADCADKKDCNKSPHCN